MTQTRHVGHSGSIDVSLDDDVFVCRAVGHVDQTRSRGAQRALEQLADANPTVVRTLYDCSQLESLEPGVPIRWISWARSRRLQVRRVAFVGYLPSVVAAFSTLRYLLPQLPFGIFRTRDEAMAFLRDGLPTLQPARAATRSK